MASRGVSNGTCYYKADERADDKYAPAGNAAYGHVHCCQLSDKINSENSCFDGSIYYSYLAGCTDATYQDDSCPNKGNYSDYQWVGLVSSGDCQTKGWVGCPNDGSTTPSVSDESSGCSCKLSGRDPDQILISRVGGLDAIGTMPASKGGSIEYEAGMSPTAASTASANSIGTSIAPPIIIASSSSSLRSTSTNSRNTTATTIASVTSIASTAPAATSPAAHTDSSNLSIGATVGIALGLGFSLISIIFAAWWIYNKRKQKQQNQSSGSGSLPEKPPIPEEPTLPGAASPNTDPGSSTWTGNKSELPGSPAQMDGYQSISNSPTITSLSQSMSPSPQREQVYRPFRYQQNVMDEIQEMPAHERPMWAQSGYGTYGRSGSHLTREEEVELARGNLHELPAEPYK